MIEGLNRTNRTFAWLRSKKARGPQMVHIIATMTVTLAFLALSKYVFHSDLRLGVVVIFVALMWALAFVFGPSQTEKLIAQNALPQSGKLLEQSQKMEAIGRLAAGVAHDFNNLLAVIIGYSDLLLESLGSSDLNRAKVEQIKQAASSAASLTRQLLTFSRQQVIQPVVLDINQTVSNTEKMLRRLIKENIEFTVELDHNLDRVTADPGQIEQIVLNLVVNARDAMPNGGKLRIQTRNVRLEGDPGAHVPSGRFILLEVTDTGTGMDQHTQAHIFEPFFTTKGEGKGSGLGLSTVFGIVTQSGGAIDVTSRVGHGTRFDLYFPSVESDILTTAPTQPLGQPQRGTETILLVEDEPSVRTLVRDELRKLGYRVVEAKNGVEACLLATQQAASLQLLLTDVVMPGMGGRELAQHLSVIKPDLRTLFISGYMDDVGIMAGQEEGTSSFLQKPFTPEVLGRAVRNLLDASTPSERTSASPSTAQPNPR